MSRNLKHYGLQSQILPTSETVSIKDQFGFLPSSVLNPTKESKERWKDAYLDDGELAIKQSNGLYNGGVGGSAQKMSEFHAGLAENIIRYWSMPGARVVDPFSGRATRGVVTTKLGREYWGYEISPITYNRVLNHLKKINLSTNIFLEDGTEMSKTEDEFSDLILTCPPYYNIEKYESVDGQLSDENSYDGFMKSIHKCIKNCYRVAKTGSFCVWVVGDFRLKELSSMDGNLMNFHGDVINSFKNIGWLHHDTIILHNISPFASLTQFQAACKRYVPKIHEYVLVFRKPGEYIMPDYCSDNLIDKEINSKKFFAF